MTENSTHEFGVTGDEIDIENEDFLLDGEDFDNDNILDSLVKNMQERPDEEVKWYFTKPGSNIELGFALPTDFTTVQGWLKEASKVPGSSKRKFSIVKLAHIILSNQNRGIRFTGRDLMHEGKPLRVSSNFLWEKWSNPDKDLFIKTTQDMLKALYVSDGFLVSASQQILQDAGFGDARVEEGGDEDF